MGIADSPAKRTTAEEILALPEDGVHRELIGGELRERPTTFHTPRHSRIEARAVAILGNWLETRPRPRGLLLCGEPGFRLRRDPETLTGIDVAYVSAEMEAATGPKSPFYDGGPVLAVEILSPSDRHEDIVEKVGLYLEAGSIVWVVDPDFRRVSIHRPGAVTETFNETHELSGDPELPGFRVRVAEIFS